MSHGLGMTRGERWGEETFEPLSKTFHWGTLKDFVCDGI